MVSTRSGADYVAPGKKYVLEVKSDVHQTVNIIFFIKATIVDF
jgi:hypothetical protein